MGNAPRRSAVSDRMPTPTRVPIVQLADEPDDDAEIEALAAHVKGCQHCKSMLAKDARVGIYIPEKLLVAAGVNVLRN